MTVSYNLIAPVYDLVLKRIYAPYRQRAMEHFTVPTGSSVLDVACGTGQNFPYLNAKVGMKGKIVGVDLSKGMLRRAKGFVHRSGYTEIVLMQMDAAAISHSSLKHAAGVTEVDAVICTYGFTTMKNWEIAFHRTYNMLKPGGIYLIHDIYAEKRTYYSACVESVTGVDLSRKTWQPLERLSHDFHFDYLETAPGIFGGKLFVALGIKP